MRDWHTLDVEAIVDQLGTDRVNGLSASEVSRRLALYGPNALEERKQKSPWRLLWEQLTATMVVVLLIAAAVSIFLGDYAEAIAILAIVVLNALLGFTQEQRAERAMATLQQLAAPMVKVCRHGRVCTLSARELVPGDLVVLEAGNLVPADGRLIESVNLRVQEAALTGEAAPVDKDTQRRSDPDLPLGDRCNMVYMGTVVTYGRGRAVITATGMHTALGGIAAMLQTVERKATPLQRRLAQLGRGLAIAALILVAVVFVIGTVRGEEIRLMILTALSLAVAAVPEGLPAVVTIALALGAQRMLTRQALIRTLPAVETLGSVTVICADKTGTLTENRMSVATLAMADQQVDLTTWPGQAMPDHMSGAAQDVLMDQQPALLLLLAGGALCNDALMPVKSGQADPVSAVGDPTETALVEAAARFAFEKTDLEHLFPRVAEIPFEAERKRMTTVHLTPSSTAYPAHRLATVWHAHLGGEYAPYVAFAKGAVDSLLEVSNTVCLAARHEPLSAEQRQRIVTTNDQLAQRGLRVLGVAYRPLTSLPVPVMIDTLEHDLVFLGMVGLRDPPRMEVKEAVQTCKTAGIRPVMITGDHPLTAQWIAQTLGIAADGRVLTGQELGQVSAATLQELAADVSVYARVTPEHKLRIVQALQHCGHIIAMTGDGVNDAPALRQADIGIAMGAIGTDVAKEAADMILLDDNFATIVAAVEEGRVLYDNIRKFIKYTLSSNTGEIWVMLLAPLLGMPLPLVPLQILWINLLTDGLPGLALTVEPAEPNTMHRPPYPPDEPIFGRAMVRDILWVGLVIGLVPLGMGIWYWYANHPAWQTMIFTTLTLLQLGNALALRSQRDSLFRLGLLSNKALVGALAVTCMLQLAVVYLPFLQTIFHTVALSAYDLALALIASTIAFWSVELRKWYQRRYAKGWSRYRRPWGRST